MSSIGVDVIHFKYFATKKLAYTASKLMQFPKIKVHMKKIYIVVNIEYR